MSTGSENQYQCYRHFKYLWSEQPFQISLPNVADFSNTTSFDGTSNDGGFGLPVYDGDIETLNDNYDF